MQQALYAIIHHIYATIGIGAAIIIRFMMESLVMLMEMIILYYCGDSYVGGENILHYC